MQARKYSIKEWAKDDRPREKLLSKNPNSLSDSELLAILIGSGTRENSAVELAKQVLKLGNDNLLELGKLSIRDLMQIKGIGQTRAVIISAALELGRRRELSLLPARASIHSSREVTTWLQTFLRDYHQEVFVVLFLNQANRICHTEIVSQGGLTSTVVDPRIILKTAIQVGAVSLILSHNHPSGNLRPSKADEELTRKIRQAAALMDITLLDHIIVSEEGYFSFADEGIL